MKVCIAHKIILTRELLKQNKLVAFSSLRIPGKCEYEGCSNQAVLEGNEQL